MVSRAKLAFTVSHPDGFSPSTSQALEQRAAMWFWMLVAVSMGLDDKKCTVKPGVIRAYYHMCCTFKQDEDGVARQ